REGPEAFIAIERVDGRLRFPSIFAGDLRLAQLRIVAPVIRLVRTGPAEFNVSDLIELFANAPPRKPTTSTATQERVSIARGRLVIEDRSVSPHADWSIQSFDLEGSALTTHVGRDPGRVTARMAFGGASLEIIASTVRLGPVDVAVQVKLK